MPSTAGAVRCKRYGHSRDDPDLDVVDQRKAFRLEQPLSAKGAGSGRICLKDVDCSPQLLPRSSPVDARRFF